MKLLTYVPIDILPPKVYNVFWEVDTMGIYNKYTEAEITILRQNYSTASKDELQALLPNRTWDSILRYGREVLKLDRSNKRIVNRYNWNSEKIQMMIDLLKSNLTIEQVAKKLGCTRSHIQGYLKKMNMSVTFIKRNFFRDSEIATILKHFENAPKEYLLEKLPTKQWEQIYRFAHTQLRLNRNVSDTTYLNYDFFDDWTEMSTYLLGFIMADGYIHLADDKTQRNILSIEVSRRDSDIIYKIAQVLAFRGRLTYTDSSIGIQISNRHIIEQVAEKGIPIKNKSFSAKFPNNIPENMLKHFIRGLIDGDGWCQFTEFQGTLAFNIGFCGTYDMIQGVRSHLNIDCADIQIVSNTNNNFKFNVRGHRGFQIASWLYDDAVIYLDRKHDIYQQSKVKYLLKE